MIAWSSNELFTSRHIISHICAGVSECKFCFIASSLKSVVTLDISVSCFFGQCFSSLINGCVFYPGREEFVCCWNPVYWERNWTLALRFKHVNALEPSAQWNLWSLTHCIKLENCLYFNNCLPRAKARQAT